MNQQVFSFYLSHHTLQHRGRPPPVGGECILAAIGHNWMVRGHEKRVVDWTLIARGSQNGGSKMEDERMEEGKIEEKDISRRDFMKKTLQYASIGAVAGSVIGMQGINPPSAEAAVSDFLKFMHDAQVSQALTGGFIQACGKLPPESATPPTTDDIKRLHQFFSGCAAELGGPYQVTWDDCRQIIIIMRDITKSNQVTFSSLPSKDGPSPCY